MADISKINPVSSETKDAIRRRSAAILPNHPSASGWSVEAIRKALYEPILSVIDEINRITNEINLAKVNRTTTVNGHALTGNVTVSKSDVGLGNVNNTSDADKPVSTAQQAALEAAKAALIQKIDALPKALSAFENDAGYIKNDVEDLLHYSKTSDSAYDLRVSYDEETYKITLQLEAPSGQLLGTAHVIDLPIESLVTHAQYQDGNLVLILDNGNELSVPISEIVRGLVGEERTIAGLDLRADITAAALKHALGLDLVENVSIKDLHIFTRFSASADGSGFTEEWSAGQQYVGHAIALEAPTDKSAYTWYWFNDTEAVPPVTYSEGLVFTLNDDGESYAVAGIGDCTDMDVLIPPTYEGLPVTRIETYALSCLQVNSVTVPDSVEVLDDGAFCECSCMTIYLSSGIKSISSNCFIMAYDLNVYCAFDIDAVAGAPWSGTDCIFYFNGEEYKYSLGLVFEYDEVDDNYFLTSTGSNCGSYMKIPPTYNGCPVRIAANITNECGTSTIFLPKGLVYIDPSAFSGFCDITINCEFSDIDDLAGGAPWGAYTDIEGTTVNYNVTL